MKIILALLLIATLALSGKQFFRRLRHRIAPDTDVVFTQKVPNSQQTKQPYNPSPAIKPATFSRFTCDGRIHCSQMRSCEEAMFFLEHCPGTQMDGDGDGRPCEDKCGH